MNSPVIRYRFIHVFNFHSRSARSVVTSDIASHAVGDLLEVIKSKLTNSSIHLGGGHFWDSICLYCLKLKFTKFGQLTIPAKFWKLLPPDARF